MSPYRRSCDAELACGRITNGSTKVDWGDRRGLNPRQPEPQSGALPTELRPPKESAEDSLTRRACKRFGARKLAPFLAESYEATP